MGGGFARGAAPRRLEKKLRPDEAAIALVGRDKFTLFTPMLPEVSSGSLEPRPAETVGLKHGRTLRHSRRRGIAEDDELVSQAIPLQQTSGLFGIRTVGVFAQPN